ncbi:Na+/H+ antiporter [Planctomycetota bacterium]
MSLFAVELVVELLVIATVVAVLAKYFRVPYTVFLVLVGLGISLLKYSDVEFLQILTRPVLSEDLILLIFLPPLLFEGTINMDLEILRRHAAPVAVLALFGTFVATALMGLSLYLVFGLAVAGALLIGAILAPTDPVSVLAVFKEEGVNKNLSTLVEGESVFNDGIAVVLFLIFRDLVTQAQPVSLEHCLLEFLREILIGGGIGIAFGYVAHRVMGRIDHRFTETMLSVALAYGVYVVAKHAHASGVIAVVAAGLIIGNYGKILSMSPTTRLALTNFWEIAAFMVNSILFLLMGMACEPDQLLHHWHVIAVAFLVMVVGRSVIIYGAFALLNRIRRPVPTSWQHIINWGGLRGSIPVALVLGIPADLQIEMAGGVLTCADVTQIIFGVVVLSLLIQGLTIGKLLAKLGFGKLPLCVREYELLRGRTISLKAGAESLAELRQRGEVSERVYESIHGELDKELQTLQDSTTSLLNQHTELNDTEFRKVADSLLLTQRAALEDAFRQGLLSEEAMEKLVQDVDAKLASHGSPFYAEWEIDDVPDLKGDS